MALFDLLKKKKKEPEKKEAEKEAPKEVPKLELEKEKPRKRVIKRGIFEAWGILKGPHIAEKATQLQKEGKYIFKVFSKANKTEVKKAIESLYGVSVRAVNIINIHPKSKKWGRTEGFRKGYKKAIVALEKGEKIEIAPH